MSKKIDREILMELSGKRVSEMTKKEKEINQLKVFNNYKNFVELKMFVAKEKAKFSKLQTAPLSNLMTIIKIKAEKEFGILFVQNNWEAI